MQIKMLEENKIRVDITTEDLDSMNIDIDALGSETIELNRFLFNIMETIKAETGFDPYGAQVLMEAARDKDGNISILISKVKQRAPKITREQFKRLRDLRPVSDDTVSRDIHIETFYIESFDDVCRLLRLLKYNILLKCALYKMDNEYCVLMEYSQKTMKALGIMAEFSLRRSHSPMQEAYVREHGELIARGRRLAMMGKGIKELENA